MCPDHLGIMWLEGLWRRTRKVWCRCFVMGKPGSKTLTKLLSILRRSTLRFLWKHLRSSNKCKFLSVVYNIEIFLQQEFVSDNFLLSLRGVPHEEYEMICQHQILENCVSLPRFRPESLLILYLKLFVLKYFHLGKIGWVYAVLNFSHQPDKCGTSFLRITPRIFSSLSCRKVSLQV